jgi:hypothetical protein
LPKFIFFPKKIDIFPKKQPIAFIAPCVLYRGRLFLAFGPTFGLMARKIGTITIQKAYEILSQRDFLGE